MKRQRKSKFNIDEKNITVLRNVFLDFDDEPYVSNFQRMVINKKGGKECAIFRNKLTKNQYKCIRMLAQLGAKFIINL